MKTYNVILTGDHHVGSAYGLLPPGYISEDGSEIGQNPLQEHLWSCWEDATEKLSRFTIDRVIHMGDGVDGEQRRQGGTERSLQTISDQQNAAVDVLRDFMNRLDKKSGHLTPLSAIWGTPYHDGDNGQHIQSIFARIENCSHYNTTTRFAQQNLTLDFDGIICHFSHGVGGGGGFTKAGALETELVNSLINPIEYKGSLVAPRLVAFAHRHIYCHVEVENAQQIRHGLSVPCWEDQTSFMSKNSSFKMVPRIGLVLLHITPEAQTRGSDPIRVSVLRYSATPRTVLMHTEGEPLDLAEQVSTEAQATAE